MPILVDTTTVPGTTIVYDDSNGGVAIDYTSLFSRIAVAAETTQVSIANIETSIANIETSIANIETSIANIEDDINRLRELADPEYSASTDLGIRVSEPYRLLSYALLYKALVLESGGTDISSPSNDQQSSINKLKEWIAEFESNFGEFK